MATITSPEQSAGGPPRAAWRSTLHDAPPPPPLPDRGTPVALVAAHPDDETLGASALLQRLSSRGCAVTIVLVTDGEAAYPGRSAAEHDRLAERRRTESRAALDELGLAQAPLVHLGLPDAEVEAHEDELGDRLADLLPGLLGGCQPDGGQAGLVLLPWRHDPHPDLAASARATLDALRVAAPAVEHWEYPVWLRHGTPPAGPEVSGLTVARLTDAEAAARRAAIGRHRSLVHSPYPELDPALPPHVLELFDDGVEPWFAGRP